ncbi:MAG TPA: hypothetical protein VJK51_01710 [Candidatus Nanoarchaeia archaeon]|nr:hypothetical protein [Candidatus Nanoarchaeia archaeon]
MRHSYTAIIDGDFELLHIHDLDNRPEVLWGMKELELAKRDELVSPDDYLLVADSLRTSVISYSLGGLSFLLEEYNDRKAC